MRLTCFAATALLAAAGCGGESGPRRVPLSGRLMFEGHPVPDMAVNFSPIGTTTGNGSIAATDRDGRFTLVDVRLQPGVFPGEYRVHFYPTGGPSADEGPAAARPAAQIPALYFGPERSPVTATVPDTGGTVEIELTRTGRDVKVVVTPGPPTP